MITLSTGLMARLLVGNGLQRIMEGGTIRLYPGPRPRSANTAVTQTALAGITKDGAVWQPAPNNAAGGLMLTMVAGAYLEMAGDWIVQGAAHGTAIWFRWCAASADAGAYSDTLPRIDGECGTDLILPSYVMAPGLTLALERFVIGFPQVVS